MDNRDYENALLLAIKKHAGQSRKDKTPYINHPIRVALRLKEKGYDLTYQIAGLFHDLLEDTDASEDEIRVYGEDILTAVKLLTKKPNQDMPLYVENILHNPIAKAVKEADRNDNLIEAASCEDLGFMERYLDETNKYYINNFSVSESMDILIEGIKRRKWFEENVKLNFDDPEIDFFRDCTCGEELFAVKSKTSEAYEYYKEQKVWKTCDYYEVFDIEEHPHLSNITKEEIIEKTK